MPITTFSSPEDRLQLVGSHVSALHTLLTEGENAPERAVVMPLIKGHLAQIRAVLEYGFQGNEPAPAVDIWRKNWTRLACLTEAGNKSTSHEDQMKILTIETRLWLERIENSDAPMLVMQKS